MNDIVDMLNYYRMQCAQQTNPSQLVLPETLKLFPLYMLVAIKSAAFTLLSNKRWTADDKIAEIYRLVSMPIGSMSYFFYPRLYRITDIIQEDCDFGEIDSESGLIVKPKARPCRMKSLSHFEVYLVDDGSYLTVLVGN